MSKKMILVVALLLIVPVVLGACGGDKKDKKEDENRVEVPLTQMFESESGIALNLPDGWAAENISGGVRTTNSQEFLAVFAEASLQEIPAGMVDLEAQVLPLNMLAPSGETSMKAVLTSLLPKMIGSDPAVKATDVEGLTIGDREAARTRVTSDKMAGAIHVVKLDENNVMLVSYLTRPDEIATFEDTLAQVVDAIDYTAPAQ
jgi:hypothetical protein